MDAETGVGVNSDEAIINKARWRRLRAMVETGETRELGLGVGQTSQWWCAGGKLAMHDGTHL